MEHSMDGSELKSAAASVAENFLRSLTRRGIEYVFANAGTDHAPVIEAMVRLAQAGEKLPRFLTVPHENLAVSMAHGYYLACGKPAGVIVHVTVGTGNTVCAMMNASRDNVPLLLMAGRTPITQAGHIASRTHPIHWGQESFDQAGVVREYAKWDFELRAGQPVDEVIGRALDIACSEPKGPVYLTLPREVLADPDPGHGFAPISPAPSAPQPAGDAIARLAEWIADAEWPLIVTSRLGRDPAAVAALAELANAWSIPVLEASPTCVNLPASHPLNCGTGGGALLDRADLIVVLDSTVPWFPRHFTPGTGVRVAHLGVDPLYPRYPIRVFPADLVVPGDSQAALELLGRSLAGARIRHAGGADQRRRAVADLRAQRDAALEREVEAGRGDRPIRYSYLAHCLREVMPADSLIVSELGVSPEQLRLEHPGQLLGVGLAGGLGFALGAALGAKLAAPDRTVIATLGDGSYMFGNPTPFHFVARAADLPVLTILCNNRRWQAVESSTRLVYPDGLAAAAEPMPLVELEPSPEFTKVAEASDAFALRVDDPDRLPDAIEQALAAVHGGRQALLDVRMEHGRR
jgi:acetolactate synthase I/II/III large subunit